MEIIMDGRRFSSLGELLQNLNKLRWASRTLLISEPQNPEWKAQEPPVQLARTNQ